MARQFLKASSEHMTNGTTAITVEPFSISAWVNPLAVGSTIDTIVSINKGSSSSNQHTLMLGSSNGLGAGRRVVAMTRAPTWTTAVSSTTATEGVWSHILGVWTTTSSRTAYLNGGGAVTNTDEEVTDSLSRVGIGVLYDSTLSSYAQSIIAEVVIWNVALTAGEALALSTGVYPTSVRPGAVVSYWPIYGFLSPEPDLGGGQRDMALVNTPAAANHAPVVPYSRRFWAANGPLIEAAAAGASQFPEYDRQARQFLFSSPLVRM